MTKETICDCRCTTSEYSDHALTCPFYLAGKSARLARALSREAPTSKDVVLRPCPFCGSSRAPELLTHAEIQKLDDHNTPDDYAVCCVIGEDGCGATGGYRRNEESAIDNWNGRSAVETTACSEPSTSDTQESAVQFIVGVAKDQRFSNEYLGNVVRSWLHVLEKSPVESRETSADVVRDAERTTSAPLMREIAKLDHIVNRASFAKNRADPSSWVLYLLSAGEISVGKALEWLHDYIHDGKQGPLPIATDESSIRTTHGGRPMSLRQCMEAEESFAEEPTARCTCFEDEHGPDCNEHWCCGQCKGSQVKAT